MQREFYKTIDDNDINIVIVIWRLGCRYYGGNIDDNDINDDDNDIMVIIWWWW